MTGSAPGVPVPPSMMASGRAARRRGRIGAVIELNDAALLAADLADIGLARRDPLRVRNSNRRHRSAETRDESDENLRLRNVRDGKEQGRGGQQALDQVHGTC